MSSEVKEAIKAASDQTAEQNERFAKVIAELETLVSEFRAAADADAVSDDHVTDLEEQVNDLETALLEANKTADMWQVRHKTVESRLKATQVTATELNAQLAEERMAHAETREALRKMQQSLAQATAPLA